MASNTSAGIDEILTCPICLEILDAPKILQCLHRFCTNCLEDTVRNCPSTELKCPICRQVFVLPSEGVGGMKGDFLMEAILENHKLAKELEQKKKERKCNSCDEVKTSEAFCPDCGGFLCDDCYEPHKTMKSLKAHVNLILLADLQTGNVSKHVEKLTAINKAPKCSHHVDQILYFNCKTCSTLICPVCAPISHKTHDIEEVVTTFSSMLQQLEDLREITDEDNKKIRSHLQKVDELTAKVEKEAENRHIQMRLDMSSSEDEIRREKEALIAKIENEARERVNDLHRFSEDSGSILDIRKAATIAILTGIRDQLRGIVIRNEMIIKNACLFNDKSDMWSAMLAIPGITRAFENVKTENCLTFPALNSIEKNGLQLYKPLLTRQLPNSPFENETWNIQQKFCLSECKEDNWTLSSVSSGHEDFNFIASCCRSMEYSMFNVNLNNTGDKNRRACISIDGSSKWKTFPPNYCCSFNKGYTIAVIGNNLYFSSDGTKTLSYTVEPGNLQINALTKSKDSEINEVFLTFGNAPANQVLQLRFDKSGNFTINKGIPVNISGFKHTRSVDVWQGNILVCDGHSKACALDSHGTLLHEYSHGVTKRSPLSICADRFGSVFILQNVMMSSGSIQCVDEYTFAGKCVTSWKVPDNTTVLTTVRYTPEDDGLLVGAINGEITSYRRTEYGKYLTSLMRDEAQQ